MAHYRLSVENINRKRCSITMQIAYMCGKKLNEGEKTYSKDRSDVIYHRIFLPKNAPDEFKDLQTLSDKLDAAEIRKDARTGRCFIGSLPNELPPSDWIRIVSEYIEDNFRKYGLCAIAAIHRGENKVDPSRNNPHVHIIVSTRTVDANGFSKKKAREFDTRAYLLLCRESWADVQNRTFERNGLDIRVSHESLKKQGIDREPKKHLSPFDIQKEQRGEHTRAGDENRMIQMLNQNHVRQKEKEQMRKHKHEKTR